MLKEFFPQSGDLTPGASAAPMEFGPHLLGVYICYEDLMPGFVRRIMAVQDGRRPQVMFNLTNDSWFGDTIEPFVHLALAAFRSVEQRRVLVRSTNTGISAVVDAAGRIGPTVPQLQEGSLVVRVPLLEGTTVYQVIGDAPAWACLGLMILLLLLGVRRAPPGAEALGAPIREVPAREEVRD